MKIVNIDAASNFNKKNLVAPYFYKLWRGQLFLLKLDLLKFQRSV